VDHVRDSQVVRGPALVRGRAWVRVRFRRRARLRLDSVQDSARAVAASSGTRR